jgi:hypothetical protein
VIATKKHQQQPHFHEFCHLDFAFCFLHISVFSGQTWPAWTRLTFGIKKNKILCSFFILFVMFMSFLSFFPLSCLGKYICCVLYYCALSRRNYGCMSELYSPHSFHAVPKPQPSHPSQPSQPSHTSHPSQPSHTSHPQFNQISCNSITSN